MRFEYPAFLFALTTLTIPVVVHLFNFRRYKKVFFSNVQFLKQIDEQQATKRNLKERLILLSRLLALLFLVLAFAKPYFTGSSKAGVNSQQVVSIFIDNSYSMQALGSEGSLLDQAKSKAKEIASGFGPNTRFQLLTQDFLGKDQRLVDRAQFINEVDGVVLSPQSRTMQSIVNRQQSLLSTAGNADHKIFIVSDFQRNMADRPLKLPEGASLNLIQLRANELPNIAIDTVWLQGAIHRPGETEKLIFKLHNYADQKATNVPVKLFINKQQKALGSYTINSRSSVTDTLSFSGLHAGWETAKLTLQDNPVTFDNTFHFSFNVYAELPILLINEDKPNEFVNAAFASEPFFRTTSTTYGNVNYSSLHNYPLIVLTGLNDISPGLAQQLKVYVQKGGNLAVFPSTNADLKSYREFLSSLNLPAYGKTIKDSTKVSVINVNGFYKNVFENMPQNPDMPKVNAYYNIGNNQRYPAEKLMNLPNGDAFWEKFKIKQGAVYLCAAPLDETFSNLPRHSLFVTTMLRIGLLSGYDQPLYATIGEAEPIALNNIDLGTDDVLKLSDGPVQIIPDVQIRDGEATLYLTGQNYKPGTYHLLKRDSFIQLVSFNSNKTESDMTYANEAQLEKIGGTTARISDGRGLLKGKLIQPGLGFQLWKLCLILALIFLAAETLLIRLYKPDNALTPNIN